MSCIESRNHGVSDGSGYGGTTAKLMLSESIIHGTEQRMLSKPLRPKTGAQTNEERCEVSKKGRNVCFHSTCLLVKVIKSPMYQLFNPVRSFALRNLLKTSAKLLHPWILGIDSDTPDICWICDIFEEAFWEA